MDPIAVQTKDCVERGGLRWAFVWRRWRQEQEQEQEEEEEEEDGGA